MVSKRSQVWDFFTKKDDCSASCSLCGQSYKMGGGTTNLRNHLIHKHPLVTGEMDSSPSSTKKHTKKVTFVCTSPAKKLKTGYESCTSSSSNVSETTETDIEDVDKSEQRLINHNETVQVSS